ncbi:hypothetical protein ACE6H2_007735 [Prunus campanulata]
MAVRKPGVIALFDVDGTLTAPRKVLKMNVKQSSLSLVPGGFTSEDNHSILEGRMDWNRLRSSEF